VQKINKNIALLRRAKYFVKVDLHQAQGPDFGGNSGEGGTNLGEVQQSSSQPPWMTGQSQQCDICM
jgi:hypothetical protein